MELPELAEVDFESVLLSASGPAEYTVSFGKPCKISANVRVDSLMFSWPRVFAKALVAVYKCDEFWPHYDVKTRALSVGKTLYVLVNSVARHRAQDSELVPVERGLFWNYVGKIASAALCKVLSDVLHLELKCKTYVAADF
ncbi:hypothetical protein [Pyrobaculum aerophilum]|uniref:Uncharacterized protein n=2 Tax=Pyrobaculum aerophilum TaxID=13773 RepID=Q8ZZG4_PYRAE|nr:hypothetical protein [Pyrobaculum aerophilum]AAL62677.1 hypothetical protein PAE0276 [Pyrobaculum aerophilum str. IM2]MCX8137185.1 hypothetical protein [Pyrobaculum aerophilum]HII46729.1 hypothetical protein [Pyrobaculum aerophilum]